MKQTYSNKPLDVAHKKVWVAGQHGMVGAALMRQLEGESCELLHVSRHDLDLRRQAEVEAWMQQNQPDIIITAAAKVGGIGANAAYPADFLYDNMMIAANIIHAAARQNVEKLLFLGTSCIYPKHAPQPITEDSLMSGPLEPTNQWYAIAKIAGIRLCQAYRQQHGCNFISAMPCNLYGPGDHYHAENSHVIPAMIMKLHAAAQNKQPDVTFWGTGRPLREFLYVDDLAKGLVHILKGYNGAAPINIGSGKEISMLDLAHKIAGIVGYEGAVHFDSSKPDGTPRKVLECSRLFNSGWQPQVSLSDGLEYAYRDYLSRTEFPHAA